MSRRMQVLLIQPLDTTILLLAGYLQPISRTGLIPDRT